MTFLLLLNYTLVSLSPVLVETSHYLFYIRLEKKAITLAFIKKYIYICHKVIFEA